ncbi:hypothetical protein JRQ81_008743 [Phrynocephalus forsythii]|uniref:Uncharacterized protein n=1 Tax=Phrynocephalus forsythii TaxID=171643 RepID=A0A9Q0XB39_9SAUR|nr:hypothetical protein JRQ81_008743 [Phrynocephalus forsythii]
MRCSQIFDPCVKFAKRTDRFGSGAGMERSEPIMADNEREDSPETMSKKRGHLSETSVEKRVEHPLKEMNHAGPLT